VKVRITLLTAFAALAAMVPGAHAGPSESGWSSDTVDHVKFIPFEVGTATGARVVGKYLFVTSWKNFSIYDISDPMNPALLSTTPIGFMFENEDVSVSPDARYLLFSESVPGDVLHVWDLQSKTSPREIAQVQGAGDHTTSCLFGCKWSWGSSGSVTDLHRKDQPKLLDDKWTDGLPGKSHHDETEVRPGYVLTSSQPIMFLDATHSVTHPKLLATGTNSDHRFIHSVLWPNGGHDKFMLAGGETNFTVRCNGNNGRFSVWDTTGWQKTKKFHMTDDYQYVNGTYTDGSPPVNGMGCSSHWFHEQPQFHNGGVVAVGSYEHGTQFFLVTPKGKLNRVGWFVPFAGATSAAFWLTNNLIYTIDYSRGIDILRYHGPLK
jgi:hypothetical protein